MSVIVLGNGFILLSRWLGVPSTMKWIVRAARWDWSGSADLDSISNRLDWWLKKTPWLFIGHRQKCLIRGFVLYYQAKRRRLNVSLTFGAKSGVLGVPDWHCWLAIDGKIHYEVAEVIQQYVPMLVYT